MLEILERLKLIELAFERSRLTGMMPDRVAASIASFDFLYLSELHQRKIVAPTLTKPDSAARIAQAGGQVFEPQPGLYQNVWVFDFKSLYPSIIRTFNIDPLGFVADPNLQTLLRISKCTTLFLNVHRAFCQACSMSCSHVVNSPSAMATRWLPRLSRS